MRKTPSHLKGLAETRARADGDMHRFQRLLDEIDPKLAEAVRIQTIHAQVTAKLTAARAERDACDLLIRKFDSRLDPEQIAPIRAFKGRYGERGQLRATIVDVLRQTSPAEISTSELCIVLIAELKLDFLTVAERAKWAHNSLGRGLKHLVDSGIVERLHDPSIRDCSVGRWRLKERGPGGLEALGAAAEASGVGVSQAKRRGRPPANAKPNS